MPPANWEALRNERTVATGLWKALRRAGFQGKRFHITRVISPSMGFAFQRWLAHQRVHRFVESRTAFHQGQFDEYVDQAPIEGLDRLTLNNNNQDGSLCSQYLTCRPSTKGHPALE